MVRTRQLRWVVAVSWVVAGGCSGADDRASGGPTDPGGGPTPVIVDYSPTLSDVTALMYVAQHPDIELLAVTLAGTGESHCDAGIATTIGLLELAGRPDVPVACGRATPIGPGNSWPDEWRARSDELAGLVPNATAPDVTVDAADLLADVAARAGNPVTIIAVGPLTNLAVALRDHDDLPGHVAAIYTMGGAFDVSGNAPNHSAEWNYFIDPTSVEIVFGSGIPVTVIPLDATNLVPVTYDWFARLTTHHTTPAATAVHDMLAATPSWELGFSFWDELAAAVALDPTLATFDVRTVEIVTEGERAGRTVTDVDGVTVRVALSADAERFETALLTGLNAGVAPPEPTTATDEELAYFVAVEESTDVLDAGIAELFESPEAQAIDEFVDDGATLTARQERLLRTFARSFWTGALDLIDEHAATLARLDAPVSVRPAHDAFLAAVEALVAGEPARLARLDDLEGEELLGFLSAGDAELQRVDAACADLELEAYVRSLDVRVCPD